MSVEIKETAVQNEFIISGNSEENGGIGSHANLPEVRGNGLPSADRPRPLQQVTHPGHAPVSGGDALRLPGRSDLCADAAERGLTPIERCKAEIAQCEADLRAGHPEVEGLCLGLADWSAELRILQRPVCIDLFCGLGGWADGFLAEGYTVIGFDNHRHRYLSRAIPESDGTKAPGQKIKLGAGRISGDSRSESFNYANECSLRESPLTGGWAEYPGQLVIQDVLTLHGSQFKDAAVIVASPPCQNYSYLAMPWSRSTNPDNSKAAKALRLKWETEGPDNRLFDACFRIQREAIEAANRNCAGCGHDNSWHDRQYGCGEDACQCERFRPPGRYIPLIVENVRGAIPWVGRSAWNYGSFHLWGDVPALMPINLKRGMKVPGFRFDGSGKSFQTASVEATGQKENPDGTDRPSGSWFRIADSSQGDRGPAGQKVPAYSDPRRNGGKGVHLTSPHENAEGRNLDGRKGLDGKSWIRDKSKDPRPSHGNSLGRKAASAQIAKIPLPLAQHIAQVYFPRSLAQDRRRAGAAGETR